MRLADNPFMILGITPAASIEELDEAASDKSFADDENEELYNDARMILSSPNKRLGAEVRWFFTVSVDWVESVSMAYTTDSREKLLQLIGKRNYSIENFADVVINIGVLYEQACSDESVRALQEMINDSRLLAGVTSCEFRQVKEAVVSIIEDIEEFINEETANYNESGLSKVGNIIAAEILKSDRTIGVGFEKFINVYNVKLRTALEKYREEIIGVDIPSLKENCYHAKLQAFCAKVRNFDYLAQPLQVFLLKQGRSDLQEESIDIAKEIRSLAIYFHNEEGDSETTLTLLELENELFSELPEIHEEIKGDISTVNSIKSRNDSFEAIIKYVRSLKEDRGLGSGKAAEALIKFAPGLIDKVQNSGASEEEISEAKNFIAGAIVNFAIDYGNQSKDWENSRKYLAEATRYANDKELCDRIAKNIKILTANEANYRVSAVPEKVDSGVDETGSGCLKNVIIAICVIAGLYFMFGGDSNSSSSRKASPSKQSAAYSNKTNNNQKSNMFSRPEPKQGVVTGYDSSKPLLNDDGYCKVTIDNSQNDMPVYVRIWNAYSGKPVRAFFIEARDKFTANDLEPGTYEVRYKELYENGEPPSGAKSEPFTLNQTQTYNGVRYSIYTLTLYKVRNGNARTTNISPNEI